MVENRQIFFIIPLFVGCASSSRRPHMCHPPTHQFLIFFHSALYSQKISLSLSLPLCLVISRREDPEASSSTMPNKSSLVRPGFPPQPLAPESSSPCTFHPASPSLHFLFRRQRGALACWTTVCAFDKLGETFSLAISRRRWLYSQRGRAGRERPSNNRWGA